MKTKKITENANILEEKKFFSVKIEEIFKRTVLIEAKNEEDACDIAKNLCECGIIGFDYDDFYSLSTEVGNVVSAEDIHYYDAYNSAGEKCEKQKQE